MLWWRLNPGIPEGDIPIVRSKESKFYKISLVTLLRWRIEGSISKSFKVGSKVYLKKLMIAKAYAKKSNISGLAAF